MLYSCNNIDFISLSSVDIHELDKTSLEDEVFDTIIHVDGSNNDPEVISRTVTLSKPSVTHADPNPGDPPPIELVQMEKCVFVAKIIKLLHPWCQV